MKTDFNDLKSTCETEEIQPEISEVSAKFFSKSTLCSLRMPAVPMHSMPLSNNLLERLSSLRQQLSKLQMQVQSLTDDDDIPDEPSALIPFSHPPFSISRGARSSALKCVELYEKRGVMKMFG